MKFSSAFLLLSSVTSSVALKASSSMLKVARRLDQNAAESEYSFLNNYHLKLVECKSGEPFIDTQTGNTEYSSVVFRLCDTECSNDSQLGCSANYGDYVIGLNTFAQMYLEEKRDDMQGDDDVNDWKFEKFGECQKWDVDKDVEFDEEDADVAFYVGPACTSDEKSVRLALFTDEYCQTLSEKYTFETISNGVSLPYSSGGLIGYGCESCYGANDKGEYELSEMCTTLYMYAGKCESNMGENTHYMGRQEGGCEYISTLMPASASSGKAGAAIGWTIFALVIVGAAAFGYMHMKKKQDDKRAGLMS
jgi:hypothetical protein